MEFGVIYRGSMQGPDITGLIYQYIVRIQAADGSI